jgi:hypothetical protein
MTGRARRTGTWSAVLGAGGLLWLLLPVSSGGTAQVTASGAVFEIGAADADITPPALDTPEGQALDTAAFTPVCGSSEAQIAQRWPGKRLFAFTEPYVDLFGTGRYVPGDPYCDADGAHRYQAPYIAGGSGTNHWPLTSADRSTDGGLDLPGASNDPIEAHAVVFDTGGRLAAMVTVDSIGIFDSTMDQIRAAVVQADPQIPPADIFISSTHDESAPDPIGLWGPDLSQEPSPLDQLNAVLPVGTSSGVDEYYMGYLVRQTAAAIDAAYRKLEPGMLRVVLAPMPANTQSCWSSYPYVDTGLMPVMQGVSGTGQVVFTLVNVGTHDETLSFSGNPAYTSMLSGDWAGRLSQDLEQRYGGVGMEMAGLVGSVETPALYPIGTQVPRVPGAFHGVPGNPVDGCSSVYPEPASANGAVAPYTDALQFDDVYGQSVADQAAAALSSPAAASLTPTTMAAQTRSLCLQLENNLFAVAFAAGLFPDRPAYADPLCTVGVTLSGSLRLSGPTGQAGAVQLPGAPLFIRSQVGVLTLGPVQIAYSPGEVFPFTEVGGPVDDAQMPFPTDCYLPDRSAPTDPAAADYTCGPELPMTEMVSAQMTEPYRFLAGLGEDMIGYLFPPGNFVGTEGETLEAPWVLYEDTTTAGQNGVDRFGYGHPDDSESVGPHAGLAVTEALSALLRTDGQGDEVLPGLFVDASGHRCDSPFPAGAVAAGDAAGSWVTGCAGFSGAVGIEVVEPGGARRVIAVGSAPGEATGWATYLGSVDPGTPAASYLGPSGPLTTGAYPYSTATRGVVLPDGRPLLIDVFSGADQLGGLS